MKEHGAAADERLKVALGVGGEKFVELRQKLSLAPNPLQKWLRLKVRHRRKTRDCEVGLVFAHLAFAAHRAGCQTHIGARHQINQGCRRWYIGRRRWSFQKAESRCAS